MDTETVVRLRPGGTRTDPFSQTQVPDWSLTPAEQPIEMLAPAEPRPSTEPVQEARNAVISGWTLYLPAGADVTEHDRVRVRGIAYDVAGKPADWRGAGVVVQLTRTDG